MASRSTMNTAPAIHARAGCRTERIISVPILILPAPAAVVTSAIARLTSAATFSAMAARLVQLVGIDPSRGSLPGHRIAAAASSSGM